MVSRVRWGCPYCGKEYMIPADAETPAACRDCSPVIPPAPAASVPPPSPFIQPRAGGRPRPKVSSGLGLFLIKCLMVGVTLLWPAMILGTAKLEFDRLTEGARPFAYGQWIRGAWVFDPDEVWDEILAKKAKFHTFVFGIEITMLFVGWFVMKPNRAAMSAQSPR